MSILVDFERFLIKKYNSNKIDASEYRIANKLLQEFWEDGNCTKDEGDENAK